MRVLRYLFVPQCGKPYQSSVDSSQVTWVAGSLNLRWTMFDIYNFTPGFSILTLCPCFVNILHNKVTPCSLIFIVAKIMPKNSFISPPKRICKINIFHGSDFLLSETSDVRVIVMRSSLGSSRATRSSPRRAVQSIMGVCLHRKWVKSPCRDRSSLHSPHA